MVVLQRSLSASIVIPTRNRAAMLRACVTSVLASAYSGDQYEVIVVDDGSSDATRRVVESVRSGLRGLALHYAESKGRGLNAARNVGMAVASSDLVLFLDDDVEVPSTWLETFVDCALRHPSAGCIGGPIRLRLEGSPPRLCGREKLGETELDLGTEEIPVLAVWGANFGVRRWAMEVAGHFDESFRLYGDEVEWQNRLRKAGVEILYSPKPWLWHRRTQQDLRLRNLIPRRFKKGMGEIALELAIGQPIDTAAALASIPRHLAHAVRRRCWWGVLAASLEAGRVWGRIRRGPRVRA